MNLLHNELLGVATSVHEIDASGEATEVDAVGTDAAFLSANHLTSHVVNHDVSVLAEGDVELINGGVRIDGHVDVVVGLFANADVVTKEFVQVEGQASIVVVIRIVIIR